MVHLLEMIKNALELPKIYYGLHFYPGVAEYKPENETPYRVYVGEETIKNMGPTFAGRPVYVQHVDEVSLKNIQNEADGYVMESFFNRADGKHWVKFIVVSDRGHEAVRNKWRLSNAYVPKELGSGGLCNGVEYDKEITRGEYDHLAIVQNPRYEESVILTPDQFKEYNSRKEAELLRLANSKEPEENKGEKIMFFKKAKLENSADLENTVVQLPKSKVEMTITQLVNEMDTIKNMHGYANGDHMVKVGEEEMSVNDLMKKYGQFVEEKKNAEMAAEEAKKENADSEEDKHENADSEEDKKKENEDEKKEPELANKKKNELEAAKKKKENFDTLKNAADVAAKEAAKAAKDAQVIETSSDQVRRGQARYGS